MNHRLPLPARVGAAALAAVGIMLALPTIGHLVFGSPAETPLAWSGMSLLCTALAVLVGVAFLAWRPASGWSTLLATVVMAMTMTFLPILLSLEDWAWWPVLVVYLVVFGVYLAVVLAAMAAAVLLHGSMALRFRRAAPASV